MATSLPPTAAPSFTQGSIAAKVNLSEEKFSRLQDVATGMATSLPTTGAPSYTHGSIAAKVNLNEEKFSRLQDVATGTKSNVPVVTGLSPREGIPGTQIIIRGENLGNSQKDLIGLSIGGNDCLLSAQWESSHKIISRVGHCNSGLCDVIVTTKSGGMGTCTVRFRVFMVQIGPLQDSAVWVDESRTFPALKHDAVGTIAVADETPLGIAVSKEKGSITESTLIELFPDRSGNLKLDSFVPAWYLLQNYQKTSFQDLVNGLNYMKRQSTHAKKGPKDFLKSNLSCILDCVDAANVLLNKMQQDSKTHDWPVTSRLEELITKCVQSGKGIFEEVLLRKDRADSTRNALSIIQRFKFLFYLPQVMRANLEKGEYALVLNDYSRAKSLLSETEVPLFKEAFEGIEVQMKHFKSSLEVRLSETPPCLSEQRKVIRYLNALDENSDFGWICVTTHYNYLKTLLRDCQLKHHSLDMAAAAAPNGSKTAKGIDAEIPHAFLFAESAFNILATKLQDLAKLSQSYNSGQLGTKATPHCKEEVEEMVTDVIRFCSCLVLNATLPELLPAALKARFTNQLLRWTPVVENATVYYLKLLKSLRILLAVLVQQEFKESHVTDLIAACVLIRMHCVTLIVDDACRNVMGMSNKETWKLVAYDNENTRTALPDVFESIVGETSIVLKGVLCGDPDTPGDRDLYDVDVAKPKLIARLEQLLCSFKDVLLSLSGILELSAAAAAAAQTNGKDRPTTLSLSEARDKYRRAKIKDRKLLTVLANCDYVLNISIPRCIKRLSLCGMRFSERMHECCIVSYAGVRSRILKFYIAAKCASLAEIVQRVNSTTSDVHGVSSYVKDMVLCIVGVQAELFLNAPVLYSQVISYVVKNYCDQLTKECKMFTETCSNHDQLTQLYLDYCAFQNSVRAFLSHETLNSMEVFKQQIGSAVNLALVQEKIEKFVRGMQLCLCSLQENPIVSET